MMKGKLKVTASPDKIHGAIRRKTKVDILGKLW
jgi:hypothetical protein